MLKKTMTLIAYVFLKLKDVKDVVRQKSKKFRFRTLFDSQYVKVPRHCQKLHSSTFIKFFITLRKIELENVSRSDM